MCLVMASMSIASVMITPSKPISPRSRSLRITREKVAGTTASCPSDMDLKVALSRWGYCMCAHISMLIPSSISA